jgi:predicted dehydrogenase
MKRQNALTRRQFVSQSLVLAGAAAAGPLVIPSSALGLDGNTAPSERIVLASIGLGFFWDFAIAYGYKEAQLVALCDVNGQRLVQGKQLVDKYYGNGDCKTYKDFRDLLARKDIDAVYIATPDHWHALVTIAAAKAGKDIYCQKPLTHTVAEGRAVVDAINRYGVVFQHGTQQRSEWSFWYAAELVRNGRIGKLQSVILGVPSGRSCPMQPAQPVPEWLDWDMWLGPAPEAPYCEARILQGHSWYFISDYCVGYIAGWGIHHLDSAMQGLGDDFGGVFEVDGHGVFPKDGMYDTPLTWRVEYTFPSGVKIIDTDVTQQRMGVQYQGTDGSVFCWRGNYLETDPKSVRGQTILPQEQHCYESTDHVQNWFDCIRSRQRTAAPVEIAHQSTTLCNVGAISMLLDRKLRWDPAAERFIDDDEANRFLARPMREPWAIS